MNLPQKHNTTGTSIFTIMSALSAEYGAINLSQGFPDYPADERLGTLLQEATERGFNQYAPMAGLPALRAAIAADFSSRYNISVDADAEITITPGATYAIYTAFATVLQPGDEVIVLEPAYDSYIPNIEMLGAKAVLVTLQAPLFSVDWDAVKKAVSPRTKAIIVNTPHNPTGAVWSREDWDALAGIVDGTDIFILSDEVYEQLIYDGREHVTVMQHEALRPRSFALYSFGKVFHNTGWKLGYCIAPPALTAAFRRLHQFLAFSVNTPAQYAIAHYLAQKPKEPVQEMMQRKRDFFLKLAQDLPFKIHRPTAGSYFQLASYEGISDMPDRAFAEWLTKAYGVATIPLSPFYSSGRDDKLLRFCFAKKEETLRNAVERLRAFK